MKHDKPQAGPDGWTEWISPTMRGYRLSCCDCGLVHNFDFKAVKRTSGKATSKYRGRDLPRGDYLVAFRVSLNKRATAAVRREMKKR